MMCFSFLDCKVPHATSYCVYISQLIHFARASSHVSDFNNRNIFFLLNFLSKGTVIINYLKHFLSFILVILN